MVTLKNVLEIESQVQQLKGEAQHRLQLVADKFLRQLADALPALEKAIESDARGCDWECVGETCRAFIQQHLGVDTGAAGIINSRAGHFNGTAKANAPKRKRQAKAQPQAPGGEGAING